MRHYFTLTALDALVLSQNNATTGGHQTLDYVPGSAILGALASKAYPQDEALAWSLFHSGEVVFSNCYPLQQGEIGLPTPLSWHVEKDETDADSMHTWVDQSGVHFKRKEDVQYEQLRGKYVYANGSRKRPKISVTTKTAIDSDKGKVLDGQLFHYQHISAGQHFLGFVDCPDHLDSEIIQRLNGQLRIGRSKGSEFGRTELKPIQLPNDWLQHGDITTKDQLTLWCISDLELLDVNGCPTLSPTPSTIDASLANSTLAAERTFVRYYSVNRFNGHRQCYDTESRLISKGSVITINLSDDVDRNALVESLACGVGINRHLGFGQVIINPQWASQSNLAAPIFSAPSVEVSQAVYQHHSATPLTQWVQARLSVSTAHNKQHQSAVALVENIIKAYKRTRKFNHIGSAYQVGPSRSQWRRINDLLRGASSGDWFAKTFCDDNCIAKAKNDPLGWGTQWIDDGKPTTFADYCQNQMSGCSEATLLKAIEMLTRVNPAEQKGLLRIETSISHEASSPISQSSNPEVQS
ncbi:hypothetical protein [Vibrio mexicanus]|uniref:hypothetical protein n=1 Tax=Vibrio mexicanus TaxID=1004326 RepID=UPI00063C33A5|nr:hypothetical protein [Vibrio mexicanus]